MRGIFLVDKEAKELMNQIAAEKAKAVKDFFDAFNEVILKLIDLIMLVAPYGVFALLAALVVESPSLDLF